MCKERSTSELPACSHFAHSPITDAGLQSLTHRIRRAWADQVSELLLPAANLRHERARIDAKAISCLGR